MKNNFRKLLSTFLSAILVLSVTVAGWPATVSAETLTSNSGNLLANKTATDWTSAWPKLVNSTTESHYAYSDNSSVVREDCSYGNLLTTVEGLQAGSTYTLRFAAKAAQVNLVELYAVPTDIIGNKSEDYKGNSSFSNGNVDKENTIKIFRLTNNQVLPAQTTVSWRDFSYNFTVPTTNEYSGKKFVLNIRFGEHEKGTYGYISNYSIYKVVQNSSNLMDNYTKTNWDSSNTQWLTIDNSILTKDGASSIKIGTASYQNIYTKLSNLQPNTTYKLKFNAYTYSLNAIEYFEVTKNQTLDWSGTSGTSGTNGYVSSSYQKRPGCQYFYRDSQKPNFTETSKNWHTLEWEFTTTDSTTNDRYILIQAGQCNDSQYNQDNTIFFSDFSLVQVRTEFATAYNNGASIRLGSNTEGKVTKDGLRVKNEITQKFIKDNGIVEYGSVVTAENLNGDELTLDTTGAIMGVSYSQKENINLLWNVTRDSYIYTAYIVGFGENAENYAKDLTVRSYAKDSNGKVYYGETFTVCLYDVVYAIKNSQTVDGNQPSDTDKTTAEAFIQKDSDAYNNWVNTKTEQ